jgi:hypothetical protein
MSIELADNTGNIGQASTNTGFTNAKEEVYSLFDNGEALVLKQLFIDGYTKKPRLAAKEAMIAAHKTKNSQVRNTLVNLNKLLSKAKGFAVVQTS